MAKYAKRKNHPVLVTLLIVVLVAAVTAAGVWAAKKMIPALRLEKLAEAEVPEWVDVQLISVDGHSRRGQKLDGVEDIVIHYVGNPGTTARANRNYFASLAETGDTYASSHFVVGLEGEIIECVPRTEVAYCSNERNSDTISIEVCHEDETGEFSPETMESLVELTAWLVHTFDLETEDVIRHYDVTGKICPKYYVEHEEAWTALLADVEASAAELKAAEETE